MRPISSANLYMREMYTHRYWRLFILYVLAFYSAAAILSFVPGTWEYFSLHPLTLKNVYLYLVTMVFRLALFFVLPYWFLVYVRDRDRERRLDSEDSETSESRNLTARMYRKVSSMTIFYPDAFKDELSVCAYTGGAGATPKQRCTAQHLNAASIIALPHISNYNNTAKTAQFFVPPEMCVVDAGRSASYFTRFMAWLDVQIDYIFNAQTRKRLDRRYVWKGTPCAFAQQPDIDHAVEMTRSILEAYKGGPIVLFGSGRGANVALEVYVRLAAAKKTPVRGVVLEGLVTDPLVLLNLKRAYRWQQSRDEYSHNPIEIIKSMPATERTRFLIVNSQADTLVDTSSSFDFYSKLEEKAPGRCLLVRLEGATRGAYATHNSVDACAYEEAALHFYRLIDEDIAGENPSH